MKLIDKLILLHNQMIFDGDWDWHLRYIEEHGSEEQKREDPELVMKVRKRYEGKMPKTIETPSPFAPENETTEQKNAVSEGDNTYKPILLAIESGLIMIVTDNDNLNDFDLILSLKKLKQNILLGAKDLDHEGTIIKLLLMNTLGRHQLSRRETGLCIQHFIKLAKTLRNEYGKTAFVSHLHQKKREVEKEDEEYDIFLRMNAMDKYKFLLHSDPSSHDWADVEFSNTAMELLKEKRHEEAEALLKKGLEYSPNDFNFHEGLATVYWSTSCFEEAEKIMQTALENAEKERTENPDSIDEEVITEIKTKLSQIRKKESYGKSYKNHS